MADNTLFTYGLTEQEKDNIYAELDRADEQDSIRREQEELEQELREEIDENIGYFVFRSKKGGGWLTERFDTEKEAKHFASLFQGAHIKEMY